MSLYRIRTESYRYRLLAFSRPIGSFFLIVCIQTPFLFIILKILNGIFNRVFRTQIIIMDLFSCWYCYCKLTFKKKNSQAIWCPICRRASLVFQGIQLRMETSIMSRQIFLDTSSSFQAFAFVKTNSAKYRSYSFHNRSTFCLVFTLIICNSLKKLFYM